MTKLEVIALIAHANMPRTAPLAIMGERLVEASQISSTLLQRTSALGDEVDSLLLTRLRHEVWDREGSANMLQVLRNIATELGLSINFPWKHEFA